MSSISENDKRMWENYTARLNNLSINFQNKNNLVYSSTKITSKKIQRQHRSSLSKNGKFKPKGIIDLHGYKLQLAKITLQKYILNAYEENLRNILIITGKGYNNTGALRKEVPLWLNERILSKLLIDFKTAPKKFGGEGALIVRIKNKDKFRFI